MRYLRWNGHPTIDLFVDHDSLTSKSHLTVVTPAVIYAHFYLHGYVIILLKMAIRPRGRCPCLADAVGVMLIATIIWIVCSSFEGSFLSFITSFRCQD